MSLSDLNSEEQTLYDHVLSNSIESDVLDLLKAEDQVSAVKELLERIKNVIATLSKIWNIEHDLQGKLLVDNETVSSDNISSFYENGSPLFEMIRSRFPILRSEIKIAVGTLVNVHKVSELLELSLRENGYLTYYLGTQLTARKLSIYLEKTPATTLVLSCMAENSELQCFEELRKVREAFPELKIIVGGSAFQMFLVLKDNPDNPALTKPYKDHFYYEKITKTESLKDFVAQEFSVIYCETPAEIQQVLES